MSDSAAVPVRCVCGAGCDFLPPESWGKPKAGDRLTCLDDPASQKAAEHECFDLDGAKVHGDPHMSTEARDALRTVIAAAQQRLEATMPYPTTGDIVLYEMPEEWRPNGYGIRTYPAIVLYPTNAQTRHLDLLVMVGLDDEATYRASWTPEGDTPGTWRIKPGAIYAG